MQRFFRNKSLRRWLVILFALLLFILVFLAFVAERFVEPLLKDRLHTLIVQGSDSLYKYTLGDLDASFLGGSVEVENLHISVDSARYYLLQSQKQLPSITMELDLIRGKIKGVSIFPLLFGKRISIDEIMSKSANIRLLRHERNVSVQARPESGREQPLWKSIQPNIKSIAINKINLDGIKLLYKYADTSESMKLQFDTCYASFGDIRIDSAATADTSRIGFAKDIAMRFRDLKFRTADSTHKLKAEVISYSSKDKTFEITDFKIQPTLKEKADFYKAKGHRESMDVIEFEKATFTNFQLDQFVHNNTIFADSLLITRPVIDFYLDKTYPPLLKSKIGSYPHQKLLGSSSNIKLKGIHMSGAQLTYTEKAEKTLQEGKLTLTDMNVLVSNVTNDSAWIKKNNRCVANLQGRILGGSPIQASFSFYLDSTNGRFDATGTIKNVSAAQLNTLAVPLANVEFSSFRMQELNFALMGDDFGARGKVRMRYSDLFLTIRKTDAETGQVSTKKFLTKVINKYTLQDSNPGPDGVERRADNVVCARLSTQSFFALIWKTIFSGMQGVMMKTGSYE